MVNVTSTEDLKALLAKKANQPPTAGTSGQVLTRDTSSTTGTSWQTPAVGSGGSGTAPDATTTSKGVVQLAGDLAGTADAPALRQLNAAAQTYGDSYNIPRITVDTAGRVSAAGTVAVGGAGNATASTNGVVRLAGDLAGTASSPALVTTGVNPGTYSFSSIQSITVDAKGRITAITTTAASTISNQTAPAITGTPTVGQTLTVSNGTWTPQPDNYTYRWYRGSTVISGQTSTTYTLVTADTGYQVSAQVTAQKSGYTPTSVSAQPVTVAGSSSGGAVVSPAYYVSPSGSDSNDGSAGSPFKTLEKAQTAMRGGSTKFTYLRGGTHNRTTKLTLQSADAGTKWTGYPGETPVIDGGSTLVDAFFIDAGTTNITVDRVTFQNVKNCAIHLNGYTGGEISGCVISNCTFQNVVSDGQYGAGNGGAVRLTFQTKNNTIKNNLFQDCYCPGVSIAGGGSQEYNRGTKILNNRFLRMNNAGQADTGSIYILDRGHNGDQNNPTVIDYNYVEDAGTDTETKLFYLDDEASCVNVTNNIFCGRSHWAFQLHGSDHVTISNNVFDMSDPKWPADYLMGLYQDATGAGFTNYGMGANVFTKNIVYTSKVYQQSTMWQWQDDTGGQIAKPSVYNNLYYGAQGTLPYDKGTVTDSNAKVGNPMFTNAAGRDYSFTSSSGYSQVGFTPINQALIGPQS